MRPHIPHLDTTAMDWATPIPGLYSKVLSVDPETGARTALQRLVPSEGYKAPTVAHYHHSAEEILVLVQHCLDRGTLALGLRRGAVAPLLPAAAGQ